MGLELGGYVTGDEVGRKVRRSRFFRSLEFSYSLFHLSYIFLVLTRP